MVCGPQAAFLMDSVSTGLDTSTTFDIMKTLKVQEHKVFLRDTEFGWVGKHVIILSKPPNVIYILRPQPSPRNIR